jgi:hypothetical protein
VCQRHGFSGNGRTPGDASTPILNNFLLDKRGGQTTDCGKAFVRLCAKHRSGIASTTEQTETTSDNIIEEAAFPVNAHLTLEKKLTSKWIVLMEDTWPKAWKFRWWRCKFWLLTHNKQQRIALCRCFCIGHTDDTAKFYRVIDKVSNIWQPLTCIAGEDLIRRLT